MTLPKNDRSQPDNDRSLMTLPENDRSQLGSDRSLLDNQPQPDLSSLCCPTQEKEIDEIFPTSETSSAPVPHQSPAEDLANIHVPNNVTEALEDPKWKEAMNEEMRALQKHGTWELMSLPHGKKTVGCRYEIDYQKTFAPVAKIKTIRVLLSLSLAENLDWPLHHQFDVKIAFLHGDLEEEVYMDLLLGCNLARDKESQVCKLRKSLYGLKQSPRAWFGIFIKSMKNFGYIQSNADHILFLKRDGRILTALIVYVDDIVVTRNDTGEQLKLQKYLSQEFEMNDLGDLKYFLGSEVAWPTTCIFLSQRKYVLDLLTTTGMLRCKPADTPIEMNHKLCKGMDQKPTNKEQYQCLVGRLMYLANTRPDIAYAVSVISQFMHSPSVSYRNAVDRILRYLNSALEK
ncbi:unnamed protein product [Prunus armeniaca]